MAGSLAHSGYSHHLNVAIALFLIISNAIVVFGLSNQEIAGIEALRATFPNLTEDWPADPLAVCSSKPKYIILDCTSDKHIISLYGSAVHDSVGPLTKA